MIPPPLAEMPDFARDSLRDQQEKLVKAKLDRERESLRLYEPLPVQEAFHSSLVKKRILYGSNRGGKTTPAMVEVARAVTGQDPYGKWPKENGRFYLVAKNELQIGEVFFRKLFRPGAFKIIKDKKTKKWRAYRPWMEEDADREHETKNAPPLIPERFIKGGLKRGVSWKDKKKGVPGKVTLINGWELLFFSGDGEPPNGVDIDACLFDEEIVNPRWYPEISFRLGDRKGRFIWAATPQNGTEELRQLAESADQQKDLESPDVAAFKISIFDNPHYPKAELEANIREWASNPEQYKIRIEGDFATSSYLIYPEFSPAIHGCWEKDDNHPDGIEFTNRWNYYMVVDPGKTICAVSFWGVPPAEHPNADQRFLMDELYIRQCNTEIFADRVEAKIGGRLFNAFLIDPSSHRQDTIGGGKSIFVQYSEALERRGILSAQTGSGFIVGANDQSAGILKMQSWLYVNPTHSRPKLQYVMQRVSSFKWEILRYRKRKVNEQWIDKPVDKDDHLLDTARYFAMHDPAWQTPPTPRKKLSLVVQRFRRSMEKDRLASMRGGINLGPSYSHN